MSELREESPEDTQDGEILADLFDTLLQEILDGRTPDLATFLPDRPDLRDRIAKTWALACSVAGRREPSRPVLGGYEILRELGHGGMGTVYLARHQALQRDVAIKVLPHSLAMSPRAKQRFLEEARALAKLRHDHVVHIHRIIDHTEMLAFEMEYVNGPSLRTLVVELSQKAKPQSIQALADVLKVPADSLGTRNSTEWFVRVGIRMARALGEVHRHGLVHRDVKPSNILLRNNGQPVLADFGLAREGDQEGTHASFAGTPVYAAPERLRSGDADLDARADVYSLGVTLYETLTLGPPFAGSTTNEVLRRIEEGNLPSLRKRAPNVSRDLETVIAKAMEPDRRHRYATADEFADDLERLLSLQPIHAKPANVFRRTLKFIRRHDKLALAAAAGAVLVVAVAWPLAAHARAADEAKARAATAVLEARSQLLCPENMYSSWTVTRTAGRQRTLQTPAAKTAQLTRLDATLAWYDKALLAMPDEGVRLERTVVSLIKNLVQQDNELEALIAGSATPSLPPLTDLLVRRAAAHRLLGSGLQQQLAAASARDRFAAGLFAFLRSDHGTCRECWQGIGEAGPDQPFLDACLALQVADEGQTELAYPRLFHAIRAFPRASALVFAITDVAVATGDIELAEGWLHLLPTSNASAFTEMRRRRMQADMLAARGKIEAARQEYRQLAQLDPGNPEPLQRLAALALSEGDNATAERIYVSLERRWPDLVEPRVRLARMALQRHDLFGYLQQARHVLGDDLRHQSTGGAMQLASILQLAGFGTLYREATAGLTHELYSRHNADVLPLSTWIPPFRLHGIEQALRICAVFDRAAAEASEIDPRPLTIAMHSIWWSMLRLPRLTMTLPWTCQAAALVGIPNLLNEATFVGSGLVLPFQRILGRPLVFFKRGNVFTRPLEDMSTTYGLQVLRIGDTNGDTLPDLCVTAPPQGTNSGNGFLELRSLNDGSLLNTWYSENDDGLFARCVTVMGDVDGDLCDDLAIGTPINSAWSDSAPTVIVKSGRTGETIWTVDGDTPSFGVSIASLGDIDNDGVRDLVVGVPPMSLTSTTRGRAIAYSGKTGQLLYELVAETGGVWFGGEVANAGDWSGDGLDDVLVGGNFTPAPGMVAVFDGRDGTRLGTFRDEDATSMFGSCVAGVGDIDGDGRADIAIGAPAIGNDEGQPGKVHVISSRTGKAMCELRGDRAREGFGYRICPLPDWRPDMGPAIAVTTRLGGPIGNGYVRVFEAASGRPMQTFAALGSGRFGYALVDLGDRDGDGHRDLGVATRDMKGATVMSVSWADFLRSQER